MKMLKIFALLMTAAVVTMSCATTQSATGGYDDEVSAQRSGNRVYVDDPYYGTVVLERDPISGRYFDVTNGFGRGFNGGYYGGGWNNYRRFGSGIYPNYRVYRARPATPRLANPQPAPRPQVNRQEARNKILGGRN